MKAHAAKESTDFINSFSLLEQTILYHRIVPSVKILYYNRVGFLSWVRVETGCWHYQVKILGSPNLFSNCLDAMPDFVGH